jgi:type IV pilus assembly protein PilO
MALPPLDPDLRKKLLLGAALLLGGGYLFYAYLYKPKAADVAQMETRVANLQIQNATARSLTAGATTGDVEHRLAGYRDQLRAVEGLIPSTEELPDLLDAISAQAQQTGVEISLIQPTGATQEQYYTKRTYDMAVVGNYHAIGAFLTRVGSLQRIVTPLNVVLTARPAGPAGLGPGESPKLEARFSIETYVIPGTGEGQAHGAKAD